MMNLRMRLLVFVAITFTLLSLTAYHLRNGFRIAPTRPTRPTTAAVSATSSVNRHPPYKPTPTIKSLPIVDNFPLAAAAHSAADLPPIPIWNRPPKVHVPEKTPLFIGFTRNWRLLQQAVVGYVTAGWPPSDIYVVENTGVMDSNKNGELSLQNPFFLNHTRLHMLGVNVLTTPTLFTFAQLQNFYLWTAIQEKYPAYFWSHMDVVALSYEDRYRETSDSKSNEYKDFSSIYTLALSELRNVTAEKPRWALRLFAYDRLALVNAAAYQEVGGWDTMIPFYLGDCDMHSRLFMANFSQEERQAGLVYDVGSGLDDLEVLYRKKGAKAASFIDPNADVEDSSAESLRDTPLQRRDGYRNWEDDEINSAAYKKLMDTCDAMQRSKNGGSQGRNTWQARQTGGEGEPYYRDAAGFEIAIQHWMESGRAMYREKWGHRDCDLLDVGLTSDDAWKVLHDWE